MTNQNSAATIATTTIIQCLLDNFAKPDDQSYRRAMFRQGGEYACTMVVDVHIIDAEGHSAHIITKFGGQK